MPKKVRAFVMLDGEGERIQGPAGGPGDHQGPRRDHQILAGQVRFKVDQELVDAPTGSLVFIPRGTPHCLQNTGQDPARLLVMFTPAGMERFFEGNAKLPPGPFDAEAYRAVAHSAWMEAVGKPLAES